MAQLDTPPTTEHARWYDLAAVIATIPGSAEHLLRHHAPTAHGRCTGCTEPGTGRPLAAWPCSLHQLATEAMRQRELTTEAVVPTQRRRSARPGRTCR